MGLDVEVEVDLDVDVEAEAETEAVDWSDKEDLNDGLVNWSCKLVLVL